METQLDAAPGPEVAYPLLLDQIESICPDSGDENCLFKDRDHLYYDESDDEEYLESNPDDTIDVLD